MSWKGRCKIIIGILLSSSIGCCLDYSILWKGITAADILVSDNVWMVVSSRDCSELGDYLKSNYYDLYGNCNYIMTS